MQEFSIERPGKPDLDFAGEVIGQSAGANPLLRIFRTKGGEYIAAMRADSQRANALPFAKPAELITWVKNILGSITEEAQVAIEQAAKADGPFKAYWTERIE